MKTTTRAVFGFTMALIVLLFIFANKSQALTYAGECDFPENFYIASYEDKNFVDGFFVWHQIEGFCNIKINFESKPSDVAEETFLSLFQALSKEVDSGVYKVTTTCPQWGNFFCGFSSPEDAEKVSENPQDVFALKSEWKERGAESSSRFALKYLAIALAEILIVVPLVLFPLFFLRKRVREGKASFLFIVVSTLFKSVLLLLFASFFLGFFPMLYSSSFLSKLNNLLVLVLLISLIVDFIVLAFLKIRNHKRKEENGSTPNGKGEGSVR